MICFGGIKNTVRNLDIRKKYQSKTKEAEDMYLWALAGKESPRILSIHRRSTDNSLGIRYKNRIEMKAPEETYLWGLARPNFPFMQNRVIAMVLHLHLIVSKTLIPNTSTASFQKNFILLLERLKSIKLFPSQRKIFIGCWDFRESSNSCQLIDNQYTGQCVASRRISPAGINHAVYLQGICRRS